MQNDVLHSSQELSADRSEHTLRAATDLFLERGYAGVSIDAVISRAGGSKRDLYRDYGDKEGLFRYVIAGVCEDVMKPLRQICGGGGTIEEDLTQFGATFLGFLLTPRVIALQKLVMSEASRFPDFAKDFVQHGPTSAYQVLERLLSKRSNEIVLRNPRVGAAIFCDMLIADLQFRTIAGIAVSVSDIEERVATAVSVFLDGVRIRG